LGILVIFYGPGSAFPIRIQIQVTQNNEDPDVHNTGFIFRRILNFDPPFLSFFFNIPVPETPHSTTSEVGDPPSVASSATPVSGHLKSEAGAQLPTTIMADLRPGDEVLIVLNNADTDRAAAFCQIQGKDDEAVEYILDNLPTEFAARQQQQEGRGEAALAVGDSVVVHCAMEGTCYRGVVLELTGGGQAEVPVLQMDFGTVVKVKIISYLLRIQICIRIQF
jgi:hypothetical protein